MEKQPMAIEVRGARVHNLKNIGIADKMKSI